MESWEEQNAKISVLPINDLLSFFLESHPSRAWQQMLLQTFDPEIKPWGDMDWKNCL